MVSKVNQMTITKDTIRKISNLAKISIADQEVEKLESEISSIIRWVEALNELILKTLTQCLTVLQVHSG